MLLECSKANSLHTVNLMPRFTRNEISPHKLPTFARCGYWKRRDVTVLVLDRPRHDQIIKDVREAGARIKLISDGDVGGAIEVAKLGAPVDVLFGIGGTPEGGWSSAQYHRDHSMQAWPTCARGCTCSKGVSGHISCSLSVWVHSQDLLLY